MLKRFVVKLLVAFQLNSILFQSLLHANFFETYERLEHSAPAYVAVNKANDGLQFTLASRPKGNGADYLLPVSILDTFSVPSFNALSSQGASPRESDAESDLGDEHEHESNIGDYLDDAEDSDSESVFTAHGVEVEASGSSFKVCGLDIFVNNAGEMLVTGVQEAASRPVFLSNQNPVIFRDVRAHNLQVMAPSFTCVGNVHSDYLALIGMGAENTNSTFMNAAQLTAKQIFLENLHATNSGSIDTGVLRVGSSFENLGVATAKETQLINGHFKNQGRFSSGSIAADEGLESFENTATGILQILDDGWLSVKGATAFINDGVVRGGEHSIHGSSFAQNGIFEGVSLNIGKDTRITTADTQRISLTESLCSENNYDWDLRGSFVTPTFMHAGKLSMHGSVEAAHFKGFGVIEKSGSLIAREVNFTNTTLNEGFLSSQSLDSQQDLEISGTTHVVNAATIKGKLRVAPSGTLKGVRGSLLRLNLEDSATIEGIVGVDDLTAKVIHAKKPSKIWVNNTTQLNMIEIDAESEVRLSNLHLNDLLIQNKGLLVVTGLDGRGDLRLDNDGRVEIIGNKKTANSLRFVDKDATDGLRLRVQNSSLATLQLHEGVYNANALDISKDFTNQGAIIQVDADVRVKRSNTKVNDGTWISEGELALPEYKGEDVGKLEVQGNLNVTTELDAIKALEGVKSVKAARVSLSAPIFTIGDSYLYSWPIALDITGDTNLKGKFEAPSIDLRTRRFLAAHGNPLARMFARNDSLTITTEHFDNSHGQLYGKTGVSINGFSYFKNGDRLAVTNAKNGELKYDRNKAGIFSKDGPIVISTPQPIDILNYYGIISSKEDSVTVETLGNFTNVTGFVFAKNRGRINAKQIQLTRDESYTYPIPGCSGHWETFKEKYLDTTPKTVTTQRYVSEMKFVRDFSGNSSMQMVSELKSVTETWPNSEMKERDSSAKRNRAGCYCAGQSAAAESSDQSVLWCEGGAWDPQLKPGDVNYVAPQNRGGWELHYQHLHTLASQVWSGGHINLHYQPLGAAPSHVIVTNTTEDPKAAGTKIEERNTHKSLFKAACDIRGELGEAKVNGLFDAGDNIAFNALRITFENLGLRKKAAKGVVIRLMRDMRQEAQSARMLEVRSDEVIDSTIPFDDTYNSIGVVNSVGRNSLTNNMAVTCSAVKQQLSFILPSLSKFCRAAGFTVDQLIMNGYRSMSSQAGALSRSVRLNTGELVESAAVRSSDEALISHGLPMILFEVARSYQSAESKSRAAALQSGVDSVVDNLEPIVVVPDQQATTAEVGLVAGNRIEQINVREDLNARGAVDFEGFGGNFEVGSLNVESTPVRTGDASNFYEQAARVILSNRGENNTMNIISRSDVSMTGIVRDTGGVGNVMNICAQRAIYERSLYLASKSTSHVRHSKKKNSVIVIERFDPLGVEQLGSGATNLSTTQAVHQHGSSTAEGSTIQVNAPLHTSEPAYSSTHTSVIDTKKGRRGLGKRNVKTTLSLSQSVRAKVCEFEGPMHAVTDISQHIGSRFNEGAIEAAVESSFIAAVNQASTVTQTTSQGTVWNKTRHESSRSTFSIPVEFRGLFRVKSPQVLMQIKESSDISKLVCEDMDGNATQPTTQLVWDTHHVDKAKVTKSLSMGASLITKLAMGILTYGTFAGASLLANVGNAGFSTLCGQATVSLVENNGDPLKATRALASADTLRSVGRSMATAGVVHGLTAAFCDPASELTNTANGAAASSSTGAAAAASSSAQAATTASTTVSAAKTLSDYARDALIQSAADTVVSAVMDGIPIDKILQRGLMTAALNTAAAYTAGGIGNRYKTGSMDPVTHKIYHGLVGAGLGAGIAAIDKREAGLGALSGMMGAVVAETVSELTAPNANLEAQHAANENLTREKFAARFSERVKRSINFGTLSAAVSAFALGLEADIAHASGVNATSHNHATVMAVMQDSALDLYDQIMLERLTEEIPLTPRTKSAQQSYDEFSKLYQSLDDVQKEAWKQTGRSPEEAANNAYNGTQYSIAEAAVVKLATLQQVTDYEKQVIIDCAKSGAINVSAQMAASIGLGVIANVVAKPLIKFAGNKVMTDSRSASQFRSVSGKINETPITWTAPTGTGQTYKVWQRTDIDWNMVRTAGRDKFVGKTNAEAGRAGLAPQLPDGSFATLHHIGQDARGALVEASRRMHKLGGQKLPSGKTPFDILHSQHGYKAPHPQFPVDHNVWSVEASAYWKARIGGI